MDLCCGFPGCETEGRNRRHWDVSREDEDIERIMEHEYLSAKDADFTVTCDSFRFKVNRALLASHSAFFKKMFEEDPSIEEYEMEGRFPEWIVEKLLRSIYIGTYASLDMPVGEFSRKELGAAVNENLFLHFGMHQIAQNCSVRKGAVANLALHRLRDTMDEYWDVVNWRFVLDFAYPKDHPQECSCNIKYQRIVVPVVRAHLSKLYRRKSFQTLLDQTPDFARDLGAELRFCKSSACHAQIHALLPHDGNHPRPGPCACAREHFRTVWQCSICCMLAPAAYFDRAAAIFAFNCELINNKDWMCGHCGTRLEPGILVEVEAKAPLVRYTSEQLRRLRESPLVEECVYLAWLPEVDRRTEGRGRGGVRGSVGPFAVGRGAVAS